MLEYWNTGILEYWNTGRGARLPRSPYHRSIIPLFRHSSRGAFRLTLFLLLLALSQAQGAAKTYSIRMPVTAVITEKDDSGKTWRRNGAMPVTYQSAVNQIKACLGGQGWHLKQTIPLGNANDRILMNFQNKKLKITVMVWKIKLNQAGFSWGIVE